MKSFLPLFLLLLLTLLPQQATAATKQVDANPINVAVVIVEKADTANIASMLKYYGYTPSGTQDGYQVMRHANGNELRYTFTEGSQPQNSPTVVIKTKGSQKSIDSTLKNLKFQKTGNLYERMVNRYKGLVTKCTRGPKNTLIFHRVQQ